MTPQATQAFELRKKGESYEVIAAKLSVDVARLHEWIDEDAIELARLEDLHAAVWVRAKAGEKDAVSQALQLQERIKRMRPLVRHGHFYFPASANMPGQAESIKASARVRADGEAGKLAWYPRFLELVEPCKKLLKNWRLAAYVAWSELPKPWRTPRTIMDFKVYIGLSPKSDLFRQWEAKYNLDELRGQDKLRLLGDDIDEIVYAGVTTAKMLGREGHADRKMILTHAGIIRDDSDADRMQGAAETQVNVYIPANNRD